MTIRVEISSPALTGQDVIAVMAAAFSGASYPIKVRVTNLTDRLDQFPDVIGIVRPPHNPSLNGYEIAKNINLTNAASMRSLAESIDGIADRITESGVLFVVEEISAGASVDVWPAVMISNAPVIDGYLESNRWYKTKSMFAVRLNGTGAVQVTAKSASGVITENALSYTLSSTVNSVKTIIADDTVEVKFAFPATATVEIIG